MRWHTLWRIGAAFAQDVVSVRLNPRQSGRAGRALGAHRRSPRPGDASERVPPHRRPWKKVRGLARNSRRLGAQQTTYLEPPPPIPPGGGSLTSRPSARVNRNFSHASALKRARTGVSASAGRAGAAAVGSPRELHAGLRRAGTSGEAVPARRTLRLAPRRPEPCNGGFRARRGTWNRVGGFARKSRRLGGLADDVPCAPAAYPDGGSLVDEVSYRSR